MIPDRNKASVIKDECMQLFSSENLFHTANADLIEKYKKIYALPNVQKVLGDNDLITTAKFLFDNSLNITLASKAGYMHRNTLLYRVNKISKLIGLDVRVFNEAVVFSNLVLFHSLIENK